MGARTSGMLYPCFKETDYKIDNILLRKMKTIVFLRFCKPKFTLINVADFCQEIISSHNKQSWGANKWAAY